MQGGSLAAIDAVELISAGLSQKCVATVGILAEREKRIERIMRRDGIGREAAEARVDAQKPDKYYRQNCSHILFNNADADRFSADCRALFKEIINHG
jgi:dephospho-CoA kinase